MMIDIHTHIRGDLPLDIPERCKRNKKYSFFNSDLYNTWSKLMDLLPKDMTRNFFRIGHYDPFRSDIVMKIVDPLQGFFLKEVDRLVNQTTLDVLIESMDRNGIEKAAVLGIEPYIKTKDLLNVTKDNERVYVFGSVNMDSKFYLEKAEDILNYDIRGFKFHPAMQFLNSGDYKIYELMEIIEQRNLPTLFDTGYFPNKENLSTDIMDMEYIIRDFKTVPIILGHMGKGQHKEAVNLAYKYENVFVDISLQPYWIIKEAVNVLGADKVLLGSDFPALKQSLAVSQVKKALKGSELYKVSYGNARKLLGI